MTSLPGYHLAAKLGEGTQSVVYRGFQRAAPERPLFYELLTRRLPFRSTDPLALIHQHLAEEAPPVHEINPEIPSTLGRLVAKLTLKQPEKRYQSGRGLLADLGRCRTEWEVGRDPETRTILEAYEPAAQGAFRSVFISGLPGIGKTRLIQELQQPIVRHRGGQVRHLPEEHPLQLDHPGAPEPHPHLPHRKPGADRRLAAAHPRRRRPERSRAHRCHPGAGGAHRSAGPSPASAAGRGA